MQNNDKLVIHVVDSSWEPISGCLEQYGCNCENVIILDLYDLNKRDEYLDEIAKIELRNPDGKKIEVGENNEYTGFYYRGQSNEAWDFNSGLYRFLNKERNAEKIKVDWDVRKFNKLTEKLNEIFSQIEVGKKNKLPRHDLQHLAAKTGYIDLTSDPFVAYLFANINRPKEVNGRIFVLVARKNEDPTKSDTLWSIKKKDNYYVVGEKVGYLSKATAYKAVAKKRIEAQSGYFLHYYGDEAGLKLSYKKDFTYSLLITGAVRPQDEYKIYPDKNPNLNEEQKKIAQETESLIKEVLGEKINNEDREYESKIIFDAINEIRDEL